MTLVGLDRDTQAIENHGAHITVVPALKDNVGRPLLLLLSVKTQCHVGT